jgi:hypothetical protein
MSPQSTLIEVATVPEVFEAEIVSFTSRQVVSLGAYEKRVWPYIMALPLMWLLTLYVMIKKAVFKLLGRSRPSINSVWFDGFGPYNRSIKDGAASWRALDIIYNYQFGSSSIIDDFWIGMMNAQAVRNRFKLARQEVRRAIMALGNQKEVRLMSLACGSAEAVIEVMAEFKAKGVTIRTLLVDVDQTALDYACELAEHRGVLAQLQTYKSSAAQVVKLARGFKPHIVEMLGLLDYIPRDKAVRLVTKIRESLEPKGIFLTCNITTNVERHFLKWVINWQMIYRNAGDLVEIARKAGFIEYRLIYEPLKIHGLLIAQKD